MLGKDSAIIAVILVALGKTPDQAYEVAQWCENRFAGRTYQQTMDSEDLLALVEMLNG